MSNGIQLLLCKMRCDLCTDMTAMTFVNNSVVASWCNQYRGCLTCLWRPNGTYTVNMCCYVTCREISVQWVTKDVGTPTVRYGMSPDGLTSSKTGNTTSYIRQDMCGPPANSYGWIDPGTMNNVVLTNLTPSTTYYYSYGDPVSLRTLSHGPQALNRKQCSACMYGQRPTFCMAIINMPLAHVQDVNTWHIIPFGARV